MSVSYSAVETPEISSSSSSVDGFRSLPDFVKGFATEQGELELPRECLVNMFNTLEKSELVELLAMAVMQSEHVRLSVGCTLSTMTTFRRLLVRNISFASTTEEVKELLQSRYGLIEEGSVVYDRSSGKSKGFAFMTFATVESACDAISDSNNGLIELKGRPILLKFAADRIDAINTTTRIEQVADPMGSGRRVFVSALAPETTSESLALALSPFGEMEECFVVSHPNGISRRFGFVTFVNEQAAWNCLQNPVCVDGIVVAVQQAAERNSATSFQRQTPLLRENPAPKVDELVSTLLSQLNRDNTLASLLGHYQ